MILKRKVFVQNIAADAAKEVVRGRRNPIAQMEYVVEYEHNSSTYNGINDTYHYKLHEGLISEQCYFTFYRHLYYLIMTFRPFLI